LKIKKYSIFFPYLGGAALLRIDGLTELAADPTVDKDPALDLKREMAFLALATKSSAVVAINFAESIGADLKKVQDAIIRLAEGDGLLAAADYRNAALKYRDAAGKVEKFLERPPARVYEEGENMIAAALDELTVLAIDPSVNDKARGKIKDATGELNKALDAIADDDAKHAIDKAEKALQKLADAEDKDAGIDLDDIKDSLAGAARSLAVDAIAFAETNPAADPIKIEDAGDRVTEGDALRDAGDYGGAAKKYQDAVKQIDKLI
jgi:tetratricopeptide (TPR) repeat protein